MNFHPDHKFPIVFGTGNDFGFRGVIGEIKHGASYRVQGGFRGARVPGQGFATAEIGLKRGVGLAM